MLASKYVLWLISTPPFLTYRPKETQGASPVSPAEGSSPALLAAAGVSRAAGLRAPSSIPSFWFEMSDDGVIGYSLLTGASSTVCGTSSSPAGTA
jgi:hypothetical protein